MSETTCCGREATTAGTAGKGYGSIYSCGYCGRRFTIENEQRVGDFRELMRFGPDDPINKMRTEIAKKKNKQEDGND